MCNLINGAHPLCVAHRAVPPNPQTDVQKARSFFLVHCQQVLTQEEHKRTYFQLSLPIKHDSQK